MPIAGDGQRIGLFGGSFNPPHEGHLNLCDLAIKQLELDQVWWMVTPGNPLKDTSELPGLLDRIALCKQMVTDHRIKITGFEASHRVRFTADTVRLVKKLRPRQKFVWLMGADNLGRVSQVAGLALDCQFAAHCSDRSTGFDIFISFVAGGFVYGEISCRSGRCLIVGRQKTAGLDVYSRAKKLAFIYSATQKWRGFING